MRFFEIGWFKTPFRGDQMQVPTRVPARGFYYHYKHDPKGEVDKYAYEVIGVGCHTEEDCRLEDVHMVIYRPLYKSPVFEVGRLFDIRPLEMFMGEVEKDGQKIPRFTKITDETIIAELQSKKLLMYGSEREIYTQPLFTRDGATVTVGRARPLRTDFNPSHEN